MNRSKPTKHNKPYLGPPIVKDAEFYRNRYVKKKVRKLF